MNFKSSEELIGRVESTLKSYKASGQIDTGDFYRWMKEILVKLNIPAYNPIHAILKVDNYKLALPEDVFNIWSAYKYDEEDCNEESIDLQQESRWMYFRTEECITKKDECTEVCPKIKDNGEIIVSKLYLKRPKETKKYTNQKVINIVNSKTLDGTSPSAKYGDLQASLNNNSIFFNFEKGFVYLQYYGFELDVDGLPMIPDEVRIEDAIETHIIYKIFLELYYNGADVQQKLQVAKDLANVAYSNALTWVKLPSVKAMINMAQRKAKKFKKFDLTYSR